MTALDLVEFLLTNGFEREIRDHCDTLNVDCSAIHLGEPLLFSAARLGRVNLVKELVDNGADMEVTDELGRTPLHYATENGRVDVVKFLGDNKADIHTKDKDGFTVLDTAILDGHLDIARELCTKMDIETDWLDGSASSLHWAAWIGRVNVVKELIGKGAYIEVKDDR